MKPDPRVTPTGDAVADNPAISRLTVERLGMELATAMGVDPGRIGALGASPDPAVQRYEAETHSPKSRPNR